MSPPDLPLLPWWLASCQHSFSLKNKKSGDICTHMHKHTEPPPLLLTQIFNTASDRQKALTHPVWERREQLYVVLEATFYFSLYFFQGKGVCVCVFVHVWVRCNPGISTVPQKEGGNSGKSGTREIDTS